MREHFFVFKPAARFFLHKGLRRLQRTAIMEQRRAKVPAERKAIHHVQKECLGQL